MRAIGTLVLLLLLGSGDVARAQSATESKSRYVAAARELLGVPYTFGGRMRRAGEGIDCQGVLFYAAERIGRCGWKSFSVMPTKSVPTEELGRSVEGLAPVASAKLDVTRLEPGDVLLLVGYGRNPAEPPIGQLEGEPVWVWHTGLYTGEGRWLVGDHFAGQVVEVDLTHYLAEHSASYAGVWVTRMTKGPKPQRCRTHAPMQRPGGTGTPSADSETDFQAEDAPRMVRLDELVPTPESTVPTTAMVRARSMPPSGLRERSGDLTVITRCDAGYCVDGLRDTRRARDLLKTDLTEEERQLQAVSATFERSVKIAHVDETYVSVYEGFTEFSGGAHANNHLGCATWNRQTARRVRLKELLPAREYKALKARAALLLERYTQEHASPGYSLGDASFLYDGTRRRVVWCALAPFVMAGTVIELPLRR